MHTCCLSPSQFPHKNLHSLLKNPESLTQIKQIHTQIIRQATSTAFSYNLLIRAYVLISSPHHARSVFVTMLHSATPDKFSLTFSINALATLKDYDNGRILHGYALKRGLYWHGGLHLVNSLMSLYFGCGRVEYAWSVWEKMKVRSVVSWTALVKGLLECGEVEMAVRVFEMMPARNVVSWTAVIDWCARNGRINEAFDYFFRMLDDNINPNEFTLVALSVACTKLNHRALSSKVHEVALKKGLLYSGAHVGTSLINMYSRQGRLEHAVEVFGQMPKRSLATWNSMIMSLHVHGHGGRAISLFEKMEEGNVMPDAITFLAVLRACVRLNMVEEGIGLFKRMKGEYGIEPGVEHCRCLVELLDYVPDEMIVDLLMEIGSEELGKMKMACRENGSVKLEEAIRCFQWEAG